MWQRFRIAGRNYEWCEVPAELPDDWEAVSYLDVRSCEGNVRIRALVSRTRWNVPHTGPVAVMGSEFPPGVPAVDPPFLLDGCELVPHGIIHTELVRMLIERSSRRKSRYRRLPLNERWGKVFHVGPPAGPTEP